MNVNAEQSSLFFPISTSLQCHLESGGLVNDSHSLSLFEKAANRVLFMEMMGTWASKVFFSSSEWSKVFF